jgi:hypothetical protein
VLYGVVREAIRAGAMVGEPLEVAHTMWAGIHGVATLHLANKLVSGRSADATLDAMTEALVRAHLPSAHDLGRSRSTSAVDDDATDAPASATKRAVTARARTRRESTANATRTTGTKTKASASRATKTSTGRATKGKQR